MAGLNLRGSLGVQGAVPASSGDGTIAGMAYGAGSNGAAAVTNQRGVAGMGAISVAAVSAGLLAWLWWTLPR